MAKKKIVELVDETAKSLEKDGVEITEYATFDLNEAENLQKNGWELLSIRILPEGKEFKFKKG